MAPGLLQGRGADINSLSRRHVFSSPTPRSLSSYLLHRNIRDLDPLSLEGADGMWYILQNGRRVLDGSGGAGVSSIGHKDLRVLKANTAHFNTGVHYAPGDFMSDPVLKLSRLLVNSTDGDLRRAVFYNSGSEATDAAKKIAVQYHREKSNPEPERQIFIARKRSYHGNTIGALASSGFKARRAPFESILPKDTRFISACYPYRELNGRSEAQYVEDLANEFDAEIRAAGPKKVAGFFVEPVVGAALGCAPAIDGYLQAMEKVCQDHGVLFIADEVMCGLGRTGAMHAYKRHGVKPDILLLGKALAGGYAPLSAMLIGDKIEEVFLTGSGTGAFNHGHTNQNHAGSCATALAVQEIVIKDKLIERVHAKASAFEGMLCSRLEDHPNVGDIRGEGYFWTVEFVRDRESKAPFASNRMIAPRLHDRGLAMDDGIFVYNSSGMVDGDNGDFIIIAPRYNATDAELEMVVERTTKLVNIFFEDEMSP